MNAPAERVYSVFQQAIFRDVEDGTRHTLIQARAGAAKTSTILEALNYVPVGEKSLFVAFNKSIAEELARRAPRGVDVKTLHGYGFSAINKACGKQEVDQHKVAKLAASLFGGTYDPRHPSAHPEASDLRHALVKTVSFAKGVLTTLDDVHLSSRIEGIIDAHQLLDLGASLPAREQEQIREQLVKDVIVILNRCLEPGGTIDFDDMVWLPVAKDLRVWQYDRVFADECQDFSPVQIELVLKSVKRSGRVCAVGDYFQSIYGWRGADRNAMRTLRDRLDAREMPLSITYRCARKIVAEVKHIVPDFEAAEWAPEGSVSSCGEDALLKNAAPGDFIISRTNAPLIGLCLSFLKEGRRAAIKGRDVGASIGALVRKADAAEVADLVAYIEGYRARELSHLAKRDPLPEGAIQLVNDRVDIVLALADGARTVAEVFARIEALFSDAEDSSRVTLSTTHKAKGLEADRVFVLADTYRDLVSHEGRCLWYVAVSRAKTSLVYVRAGGPPVLTPALTVGGVS